MQINDIAHQLLCVLEDGVEMSGVFEAFSVELINVASILSSPNL